MSSSHHQYIPHRPFWSDSSLWSRRTSAKSPYGHDAPHILPCTSSLSSQGHRTQSYPQSWKFLAISRANSDFILHSVRSGFMFSRWLVFMILMMIVSQRIYFQLPAAKKLLIIIGEALKIDLERHLARFDYFKQLLPSFTDQWNSYNV